MHSSTMIIDMTTVYVAFFTTVLLIVLAILRYKRMSKCSHKYELHKEIEVIDPRYKHPVSRQYILKCSKCGSMVKKEF